MRCSGVEPVCPRRDGRDPGGAGSGDEERVSASSADQRELVQLLQRASAAPPARRPLFLAGNGDNGFSVTVARRIL